jgi:hypothetical protein
MIWYLQTLLTPKMEFSERTLISRVLAVAQRRLAKRTVRSLTASKERIRDGTFSGGSPNWQVSCRGIVGSEHSVEVTAERL